MSRVLSARSAIGSALLSVPFIVWGIRLPAVPCDEPSVPPYTAKADTLTGSLVATPPCENEAEGAPQVASTRVEGMAGSVEGSLWDSVRRLGEAPDLALSLAGLWEWQLDLARALRPGDRYGLIVEKNLRDGAFVGYGRILAATLGSGRRERAAILFPADDGRAAYFDAEGETRRTFLRCPVAFARVSSGFTMDRLHPILHVHRPHLGVDFAAPAGTPVLAAGDGEIAFAGWYGGLGRSVALSHEGHTLTRYGHLRSIAAGIRRGVHVSQGQVIGYVGQTGLATGPHLDFRLEKDGRCVNPLTFMDQAPPWKLEGLERARFLEVRDRALGVLRAMAPGNRLVLEPVSGGGQAPALRSSLTSEQS